VMEKESDQINEKCWYEKEVYATEGIKWNFELKKSKKS
jgi:hypothetical protein